MRLFLFLCLFVLPAAGFAQTVQYFRVQSGTGFFVNREYIITNAHVVNGCDKAIIKGAVPEREVLVKVLDAEHDLALLQTDQPPGQFAPLRFNIDDMHAGDKVLIIGYPGAQGARGEYKVAEAQVQELKYDMPGGDPGHFFITDVVEHGNSGGPVFDVSGNVIGVVVAKTVLYTVNQETHEKLSEQHVGMAISLNTLKQFLFDHGVFAQWTGSGLLTFSNNTIEDNAKNYIVNVQCRIQTAGPQQSDSDGTQEQLDMK